MGGNPNERTSAMLIGQSMAVNLPPCVNVPTKQPITTVSAMGALRHQKSHSSPSMAMELLIEDTVSSNGAEWKSRMSPASTQSTQNTSSLNTQMSVSNTFTPTQISNTSSLSLSSHGHAPYEMNSNWKHTARSVSGSFSIQTLSGVRDVLEDEIMD